MRVAVCGFEPVDAVIVAVVFEATARVAIVNAVEVVPAGTTTAAGTTALVLDELMLTAVPFAGAGPVRVTVPVVEDPPATEAGDTEMLASVAEVTVRVADCDTPPDVAVMTA